MRIAGSNILTRCINDNVRYREYPLSLTGCMFLFNKSDCDANIYIFTCHHLNNRLSVSSACGIEIPDSFQTMPMWCASTTGVPTVVVDNANGLQYLKR